MFKILVLILGLTLNNIAQAQPVSKSGALQTDSIPLPPEVFYPENQFSGLQISRNNIYFLSENRLQEKHTPQIYFTTSGELTKYQGDSIYVPLFRKIPIVGLESIVKKIKDYEGFEAFIVRKKDIYFFVETATASPFCYIIRGKLMQSKIVLDSSLFEIRKPTGPEGTTIYNAGFESAFFKKQRLYLVFEYNYFSRNYIYQVNAKLKGEIDSLPIDPLPFRITDITKSKRNTFSAINYFYKGEGPDTVYRVPVSDTVSRNLIYSSSYNNYVRIVSITRNRKSFTWSTQFELPEKYFPYNWEGISRWKRGYLIVNDKYTPQKPYHTVLLYIHHR
jgi:hypothetical protein